MELRGPTGDEFRMSIGGYQFGDIEHDQYDSNWLLIDISATARGRSWRSRDACLLTWEVGWLIEWLESLADGDQVEQELDFIEPNLLFYLQERTETLVELRVYFELESRPNWAPPDGAGMRDLWVDLECTPEELREWARDLQDDLSRFPVRAGATHTRAHPNH